MLSRKRSSLTASLDLLQWYLEADTDWSRERLLETIDGALGVLLALRQEHGC